MIAPVDVSGIRIETTRLILRPWQEQDLADLYAYASVPGVGEMAGWCHHRNTEESKAILDLFIREKKTLAVVLKDTKKVIGSLGLETFEPKDPHGANKMGREIGYVLSKDYWGMGLMPEAVKAMVAYCFDTLGFDYLTCSHFDRNPRSRRVIEKCGFHFFEESFFDTRYGTREKTRYYIQYNPHKEM